MVFLSTGRWFFLVIISFFIIHDAKAQNNFNSCGTDEVYRQAVQKKSILRLKNQQAEETILNHSLRKNILRIAGSSDYTIPVVVHIIHNNGTENISDAQILTGMQQLNDAFNNSGVYNTVLGVSTGIQFCLAKQDEFGNASSGITRTQSTLTDILSPSQDLALKNIIRWDPEKYLNIWVVKEVTSEASGPGVAGYAYFPYSHGTDVDGVVCEANYFGSSSDNSKILIHELGHYLGLYHTFEGACTNTNCLTDGDKVCDTPPDASSSPALCAAQINTCSNDADDHSVNNPFRPVSLGGLGDQSDMINNYMDYGSTMCQVVFSNGQKERMVTALTTLRASLLESNACIDLCPNPIQISFTPDDTIVVNGATIQFTNNSMGASAYQWYINGIPFSSSQNPSYTFNQQGDQTIKLIASNASSVCSKEFSIHIKVNCSLKAVFTGLNKTKPGVPLTFTNTTTGTNTYEWFIDGTSLTSSQNFTHTFNTVGGFKISLVSFNGSCYDTLQKFIEVSDCIAGNQGNEWHFGAWAGLSFSGDTAVPLTFALTSPRIYVRSEEGCVSMSDVSGNFLFFANPAYVFNKNLLQMPNGSGLMGDWSATQMAAVQNPGNADRYYIFTLDALGGPDGLRYSEIDMSLDGGLGDVVLATKNTLIQNTLTEKITTVKHANGTDAWVIVHEFNTDAFYVYQVSSAGISASAVISHAGSVHVQDTYSYNSIGQLKVSPDGCKLALAIYEMGVVELFDFNNQTGAITSPVTFSSSDYYQAYGIEFSPDGSKLYVSIAFPKNIYQFNLNAGSPSAIINSRILVGNTGNTGYLGGLQLGPYGKIYIARESEGYLATINNPNASGVDCNFELDGINLGIRKSTHGLPAYNQSYFYNPKPTIAGPDTICANAKNVAYRISNSTCSSSINVWTLIGKGTIASSNDTLARIDFNGSGVDTLIVERTAACGITYDTLKIFVRTLPDFDIKDTTRCTSANIVLNAGAGFDNYLWQDNSSAQTFSASSSGKYWVTVTAVGCSLTDTIRIKSPATPDVDLGSDIDTCLGAVTLLNAGSGYSTYKWHDHSQEQTYTAFLPGRYWVTVTDDCGNSGSDTIKILSANNILLDLGTDVTLCSNETIELNAGTSYTDYFWQDGSSGNTYTVSSKGTYWVIAADISGCYGYDSIIVDEKTDCCNDIKIPSLFTPNNDQLNDKFVITCIANDGWLLEVYNRWGKLIYKNQNYTNEWNGDDISDGIYFYLLTKETLSYRGWVQVIR
jgi:gliding motility-associated-like protein